MADWLTVSDVAVYLDLPGDQSGNSNLVDSTAAAIAAVERRRSDLVTGEPPVFTPPADVRLGGLLMAASLYQSRGAPSGFTGYGDETQIYDALGARRAEILRLIGWRLPVQG
jgi:hypothetical protein